MLSSLAEGLSGRLTDQKTLSWLVPAALFWLVGAVAISFHDDEVWWRTGALSLVPDHATWAHVSLPTPAHLVTMPLADTIVLTLAVVILVGLSGFVAKGATFPVIRLAEGYWPAWLDGLRRRRVERLRKEREKARADLAVLAGKHDKLSNDEARQYLALDQLLERRLPRAALMPTRLGNLMKAAEDMPAKRYGLDLFVVWPRLWLVMPDAARTEVSAARETLDQGALIAFWGVAGIVWTAWAWWALPLALLIIHFAYHSMLGAAKVYGDLTVAAVDLYRGTLYESLRWPLPATPLAELESGREITQNLWRGPALDGTDTVEFTRKNAADDEQKPEDGLHMHIQVNETKSS